MLLSTEDKSIIKKSLILFVGVYGFIIFLSTLLFPLIDENFSSPVLGFQTGIYISLSVGVLPVTFSNTYSEFLAIIVKLFGTLSYGIIGYILTVLIKGLKSDESGSVPKNGDQ